MTLWRETLAALLAPRRLFPIALVCAALIAAEHHFSGGDLPATLLAAGVCALFMALAPWAWRWLFEGDNPLATPIRGLAYAVLGGLPAAVGFTVPELLEVNDALLTGGANLMVAATLSWVGGWGLARDIALEHAVHTERQRAEALARAAEQAQLLAVRSHLDPHFLFNTLNAIAEWCREDPEIAEQSILRLSAILREILGGLANPSWPLARELELARSVWALHQARDPSWFSVSWEVPEPTPAIEIPPLLLLPVIEHAEKHGPAKGHRGILSLRARASRDALHLDIENPGPYTGPRPAGHGVETVKKRIDLSYASRGSFEITSQDDRTAVRIVLPITGPETPT